MEELKREEIDCEAANCSFPVEVEIEIERDKTHKSKMLLCESHAELVEMGIPFRMRSAKKEQISAVQILKTKLGLGALVGLEILIPKPPCLCPVELFFPF